ncbi:membrane protein, PF10101 family [Acinetobacter sp. WC-743]|nr:membrane protein, PF10101 family [Acinetobacter sp. WC-743]
MYDQYIEDEESKNMLKGQSEIRIIWLMMLIIIAVSAWFLDAHVLTYLCGLAFVMSVMHYVDAIQNPMLDIAQSMHLPLHSTSKVPLYISSIIAVVGLTLHLSWMVGLGLTAWIFFFLRWLRRLERYLTQVQIQIQSLEYSANRSTASFSIPSTQSEEVPRDSATSLISQIQDWIFKGNPVLKVAILVLVIGIILLLRFATEHWQLSLVIKLTLVALSSIAITTLGLSLQSKNRSFALALEGLGLAGLSLTLFFAYYTHVIPNIYLASLCFVMIMLITLSLSLKQQSVELALMAMSIAYIAPFTLPVRDATVVELLTYYLLINIAIAIMSTLRPWKYLNQIGFLVTAIVGSVYAIGHGDLQDKQTLTLLIFAHTAVFIWLGFRFSQLIAKQDVEQFKLKPSLDIALIFGAPIVSYLFLYLLFFIKACYWRVLV